MEPSFEKLLVLLASKDVRLTEVVDLFTRLAGRNYQDVLTDAECLELRGQSIFYASKKSLIGWKAASHREKDRLDATALRQLEQNPRAFD